MPNKRKKGKTSQKSKKKKSVSPSSKSDESRNAKEHSPVGPIVNISEGKCILPDSSCPTRSFMENTLFLDNVVKEFVAEPGHKKLPHDSSKIVRPSDPNFYYNVSRSLYATPRQFGAIPQEDYVRSLVDNNNSLSPRRPLRPSDHKNAKVSKTARNDFEAAFDTTNQSHEASTRVSSRILQKGNKRPEKNISLHSNIEELVNSTEKSTTSSESSEVKKSQRKQLLRERRKDSVDKVSEWLYSQEKTVPSVVNSANTSTERLPLSSEKDVSQTNAINVTFSIVLDDKRQQEKSPDHQVEENTSQNSLIVHQRRIRAVKKNLNNADFDEAFESGPALEHSPLKETSQSRENILSRKKLPSELNNTSSAAVTNNAANFEEAFSSMPNQSEEEKSLSPTRIRSSRHGSKSFKHAIHDNFHKALASGNISARKSLNSPMSAPPPSSQHTHLHIDNGSSNASTTIHPTGTKAQQLRLSNPNAYEQLFGHASGGKSKIKSHLLPLEPLAPSDREYSQSPPLMDIVISSQDKSSEQTSDDRTNVSTLNKSRRQVADHNASPVRISGHQISPSRKSGGHRNMSHNTDVISDDDLPLVQRVEKASLPENKRRSTNIEKRNYTTAAATGSSFIENRNRDSFPVDNISSAQPAPVDNISSAQPAPVDISSAHPAPVNNISSAQPVCSEVPPRTTQAETNTASSNKRPESALSAFLRIQQEAKRKADEMLRTKNFGLVHTKNFGLVKSDPFKYVPRPFKPPSKKPPKKKSKIPYDHPDFLIDGKVYRPQNRKCSAQWANKRFYNFLTNKIEIKYGSFYAPKRAEDLALLLHENIKKILRKKQDYATYVQTVKEELAVAGVVETVIDWHIFVEDYMPFEFRDKVLYCIKAFGRTTGLPDNAKSWDDKIIPDPPPA